MTIAVHTLGCKVNRCDTENLVSRLVGLGFGLCDFCDKADVYIINTCTVTQTSDKKSLQMIRRARKLNPSAYVAVCGCLVLKEVPNGFPADFVFDARSPDDFLHKLKSLSVSEPVDMKPVMSRTRSFIKIQDGCKQYCSYCIVPYARGPSISRDKNDIINEAKNLVSRGTKEIVLTGINTSSYNSGGSFACLVKDVLSIDGLIRLRLSSIDPVAVDSVFLDIIANFDNLCPHFHLSLQSGSNEILNKMNRKYSAEDYFIAVNRIREILPNAAITTDVMVGFPGESEQCFFDTYSLAQAVGFSDMHIFEYSKREGTPAAVFDGQVPAEVKKQRSNRLRSLAGNMRASYLEKQVGKTLQVLFENDQESGFFRGLSREYVRTVVYSKEPLFNKVMDVKITGIATPKKTNDLIGVAIL